MKKLITAAITAGGVALSACGLVFDTDALDQGSLPDGRAEGGPADAPTVADAAARDVTPARECPSTRGPKMISADGECIDATEVTVADYDLFRKEEGSVLPFPDPCRWITALAPLTFDAQLKTPARPVVDVNYCHALHYCAWAGKRLCGRVSGGALTPGDSGIDPQDNQWLRACTKVGTQPYCYGQTLAPGACTTRDIADVGTTGACKGPYPGLSDMLGNVGEWIDACSRDGNIRERDGCTVLGFEMIRDEASCYHVTEVSRYWTSSDLGFRCCGR